jgi:lipopolysaccharide transport system ATP-binding protein
MSKDQRDYALCCTDIEKAYPIQKNIRLWKMLLGLNSKGKRIRALDGITLQVPRGKIVGILGKNGAGKSTLLRVLGGVYPPTRGRVEVHGQIAGLFEMGGMGNPQLTGREYATRYLRIFGAKQKELNRLLDDIRDFSELEEAFDHRIRTYSSGMAARLYFATATALQLDIYLIDELLSVGDEHFQAKCALRMSKLLLEGASGVLVTHDWTAILRMCEHSHVIEQGRFVFSGSSDKAVVSYLDIPRPEATVARFSPRNPQTYVIRCGQDGEIRFLVDIIEHAPVDFAISIEILRVGIGWEIILLADGFPVADQPGRYEICVSIPQAPLAPGKYALNVSLSRRKFSPGDPAVGFDSRTWTCGTGLSLHVEGASPSSFMKLPFSARKLEKTV